MVGAAVTRFSFTLPKDELLTGRRAVAISPDGRQLVYAGFQALYLRPVSEWESLAILGTSAIGETKHNPVFSPDGTSVAFVAKGVIHKIPLGRRLKSGL